MAAANRQLKTLVSFPCTVKLYESSSYLVPRHRPRQHSCSFSLVTDGTATYLRLEGQGIGCRTISMRVRDGVHGYHLAYHGVFHTQLTCESLKGVAAQRVAEGRLTVNLSASQWDMVVLSEVTDRSALRICTDVLQDISIGRVPPREVGVATHQPGGVVKTARVSNGYGRGLNSPSPHGGKRRPKLQLNG